MKKRYRINIAVSITLTTLVLTGCMQNSIQKTSTMPNSAVSSPISTNSSAGSEINYTDKLLSEGYSTEDIQSCESYLSRIMLQLNEIETFSSINIQPADIESRNPDNSVKYSELLAKIDEQKAVYYIVKLSSELNSLEEALNEYLLSLQSELDIDIYFEDKEKYDEVKNEKTSGINSYEFITVRDIEQKALENLQNINNSNNSNAALPGLNNQNPDLNPNVINPQPNIPTVEIPKPIDPSQQIIVRPGPY